MIIYDKNKVGSIVSREITIENSTFCGAKCVMCPRDEYDKDWSHMKTDLFLNIVDQAVELNVKSLDLCGFGDTFLDPELDKKLRIIKEKYPWLIIYTSTTAHAIKGKNFDLVSKYFNTIRISNYGFSKKSYETIHGGGLKYEKVQENIHRLLDLPRTKRPYIMMSFLILPENEHEIEDWKNYWIEKVDEISIWRPHNYGGEDRIDDLAFKTNDRLNKINVKSCGRPFNGNPFVRTNGDISVCCFDFNQKLTVGNLKFQNLEEILTGYQLNHLKKIHNEKKVLECDKICNSCDQIFDRTDSLVYSNNPNRKVDQPNNHPDHLVTLRN